MKAHLPDGHYEKGVKVSDQQMEVPELERHEVCPNMKCALIGIIQSGRVRQPTLPHDSVVKVRC